MLVISILYGINVNFLDITDKVEIDFLSKNEFKENDHVLVLFSNGSTRHGKLKYFTEFNTMFPVQLKFHDDNVIDLYSAIGITKITLINTVK